MIPISGPEPGSGLLPAAELEQAVELATSLARWACAQMRLPSGSPRAKAHAADLVTDTDERIERIVRERLRLAFPQHTVIGEEFAPHEGAPDAGTWVVDPVDGTTNFAHGIGWSSFSLGLRDAAGPLVAVVADPWRDELFSAVRGGGARLNGTPIRASTATDLRGQVVMTEWAAHEPWPGMPEILAELSRRWCTVRIMGSTALSLAQVAAGRAAATLIGEFHAIDGEPAMLIGTEAGAVALDPGAEASANGSEGSSLLLAAPGVSEELTAIWRTAHPRP